MYNMIDIVLPIGKKTFKLKCKEKDAKKISLLSNKLNNLVNLNAVKYCGISDENVFLLTMLELIDNNEDYNKKIEKKSTEQDLCDKRRKVLPELYHPYLNKNKQETLNMFDLQECDVINLLDGLIRKQDNINVELENIEKMVNKLKREYDEEK